MRKGTWAGKHHWIPERGPWGKAYPLLWEALYEDFTTEMAHDEHVRVQRDTKKYGPIGAMMRWEFGSVEDWLGGPND